MTTRDRKWHIKQMRRVKQLAKMAEKQAKMKKQQAKRREDHQ